MTFVHGCLTNVETLLEAKFELHLNIVFILNDT